jgi:hypothetical protein
MARLCRVCWLTENVRARRVRVDAYLSDDSSAPPGAWSEVDAKSSGDGRLSVFGPQWADRHPNRAA